MTGRSVRPDRSPTTEDRHDLDQEIEAHLAHRVDDLVAEGVSQEEAHARALAEFGDAARVHEASREVRERARRLEARASMLQAGRQDLRFALRQIRHRPGFALTALLTLMLGVGATVTVASVVQAVVFEPLPFAEPERVVFPEMVTPDGQRFSVAEPAYLDWRRDVDAFQDVGAIHRMAGTLRSPGQPRSIEVGHVSHSFLTVLGRSPVVGRDLRAEEDQPGMGAAVALISHAMWQGELGGDAAALGTLLDIDGRLHEVVGVLPPDLTVLTGDTPVFVPMGADPTLDRGEHYLDVVARLAPGVGIEAAQAELDDVQLAMSERYGADVGWTTDVYAARELLVGETVERAGWILLAAAAVLLVMASVNVSNLLMVRSTVRRTEMALRTALGASQSRLVRQLFTESALLAAGGGLLGVALAALALPAVRSMGIGRIPRLETAGIDGPSLLVGLLAVTITTLACGLAPVVQLRTDRISSSMAGARGARAADPGGWLRSALVATQISLTVVLLAGTGLLLRSFLELQRVDPGFVAEGTLAFSIDMPDQSWSWEERGVLVPGIRDALAEIPGVVAAGATAVEPFSGSSLANFVAPANRVPDRASDFTPIHWRVVTPGFFGAMGMELLEGRDFTETDDWEEGTPVVIGESLARASWGETSALDRELLWGDPQGSRMRVVGVVEDLRDVELGEVPLPIVYRPHRQIPWAVMTMVVRYRGNPETIAGEIRRRVPEALPGLPVGEIASLEENLQRATAEPRFNLQLLGGFAAAGLLLAVIGVYGLTAFDVRRRFTEIGIRLSLGASPDAIQSMILRQRMRLTLFGVLAGLAAAWVLSSALAALLYEITPSDPITWVVVTLVVVVTSLTAAWLPARRATRVEPSQVLHGE
jgi:putative ABC transport system permease protein